jgi:DNA-directed RNA polymerase specialized sigma24 family protein
LLKILAKKDSKWREIAFKICKDKMLADDIVQEMYLKLSNNKKQINDFYVIIVMRNIFFDYLKQEKKKISVETLKYLEDKNNTFEIDDEQQEIIDSVYWVARGYLEMSFDMSLRKMAKELNTNYGYIHRVMKEEKNKWKKIK